ncbi:Flp family type IVb pilin [Pseudaminobacter arsenicus]|uniref:Flp family type IVb pilin n=1 Tax=Borborobacter arsenicus TaxID=1851146 RepID=A0A432V2E7_9HYPH|nr:Flp family type IVb pilin [Pseudaminobacter arsenicus]RUM96357.1 Flp family type IVb pilin [Pseudaminobacter arsenicus]
MKKLMAMARQFRDDEDGAAMVEYTILLGIITVAVVGSVVIVGGWVGTKWTALSGTLAANP